MIPFNECIIIFKLFNITQITMLFSEHFWHKTKQNHKVSNSTAFFKVDTASEAPALLALKNNNILMQ